MKLFVIDTETSDLDPTKGATILELAWMELALFEGQTQKWMPVSCSSSYIQYNGPISPHAQASHHIRADKLTAEKGAVTRDAAIDWLSKRLEPDSILVAHKYDFDSKFLPELKNPWVCTFKSAKHIWPDAPGYGNQLLRYWLKLDVCSEDILKVAPIVAHLQPHQALFDVATTTCILQRMLEQYDPQQLLHITRTPLMLKSIGFGKHKGMDFNQIPRDYLQWLRQQQNLDDDLRHTLDTLLRR